MLGREPRLSHVTMRLLIIALLLINGVQLVLLQGTINATLSLEFSQAWLFVILSAVALLLTGVLLAFAFARSRKSTFGIKPPGAGGRGVVGSERDE